MTEISEYPTSTSYSNIAPRIILALIDFLQLYGNKEGITRGLTKTSTTARSNLARTLLN